MKAARELYFMDYVTHLVKTEIHTNDSTCYTIYTHKISMLLGIKWILIRQWIPLFY